MSTFFRFSEPSAIDRAFIDDYIYFVVLHSSDGGKQACQQRNVPLNQGKKCYVDDERRAQPDHSICVNNCADGR